MGSMPPYPPLLSLPLQEGDAYCIAIEGYVVEISLCSL